MICIYDVITLVQAANFIAIVIRALLPLFMITITYATSTCFTFSEYQIEVSFIFFLKLLFCFSSNSKYVIYNTLFHGHKTWLFTDPVKP